MALDAHAVPDSGSGLGMGPDERERVLATATQLFAKHGPLKVTFKWVAKAADIGVDQVSSEWPTMARLVADVLDRLAGQMGGLVGSFGTAGELLGEGEPIDLYQRIVARSLLDGLNPASLLGDFPHASTWVPSSRSGWVSTRTPSAIASARSSPWPGDGACSDPTSRSPAACPTCPTRPSPPRSTAGRADRQAPPELTGPPTPAAPPPDPKAPRDRRLPTGASPPPAQGSSRNGLISASTSPDRRVTPTCVVAGEHGERAVRQELEQLHHIGQR